MSDNGLPRGWVLATLDQVTESVHNGISTKPDADEGTAILRISAVRPQRLNLADVRYLSEPYVALESYHLRPGDLLFTRYNGNAELVGVAALVPEQVGAIVYPDKLIRVRVVSTIVMPRFIEAGVHTGVSRRHIRQCSKTAAGQVGISGKDLKATPIPLPPLPEQRRIVAKLDALQARSRRARAALDAIPALLDRFRQSVLAAAFRGDLTADWRAAHPDVEPASVLLERIRAERKARWVQAEAEKARAKAEAKAREAGKPWGPKEDAKALEIGRTKAEERYEKPQPVNPDEEGLPELPEGWCWARWSEVGFSQNGRAFPSQYYTDVGTKLLRPGNLHVSGAIVWTEQNTERMPDSWAEEHADYVVGPDELIMNLTAQSLKDEFLGRVCLTGPGERCLLNQRLARLTPVGLSSRFCLWVFKSMVFRKFVNNGLNTGSLIQHMFTSQVDSFAFPLPPGAEQPVLVERIEAVLKSKSRMEKAADNAADRLETLDQSILAKAFRGELVPQDPNDEPASVLLERIRAERERASPKKSTKPKKASRSV